MVGSFAFERTEIEQLLDLVAKGKLDLSRSITKIIAIDEINKGLHELEHKVGNPIRIVVGME
jgi:Zn-dependent alcohol dehydrogenase